MRTPHSNHLFVQFRRGNRKALKYFYDRFVDEICYYLQESTGDHTTADKLSADVFVALYQDRQKIKNEAYLRQFLYSVGNRLSRDYLREKGRLKEYDGDLCQGIGGYQPGTAMQRAEKAKAKTLGVMRTPALDLPARNRRMVLLYCCYDKSVAEIAKCLGIDVQTVKHSLMQQLIFLRKSGDGDLEQFNPMIS